MASSICKKCSKKTYKNKQYCNKCINSMEFESKKNKLLLKQKKYDKLCVNCNQPTLSFKNECNRCYVIRLYSSNNQEPTIDFGYVPTPYWTKRKCYLWVKKMEIRKFWISHQELWGELPFVAESLGLVTPQSSGLRTGNEWITQCWKAVYGWYERNKNKYE